jgi:3-deoxy-D-manno-octulosonate 8-phosphate phosphatase (KDO 8-P phosphatase)
MRKHANRPEKAVPVVKLLVMDVDGTLTDGKIYMGESGEIMKAFDVKDGCAIHTLLPKYGITPVMITGRQSKITENRAKELGVKMLFQGVGNKLPLLEKLAADSGVTLEEIAFIGRERTRK